MTASMFPQRTSGQGDHVRFMVVAGARTGSTMLVRALNSSPAIRCFGELFNAEVDFVPFGVEGYDDFSDAERALRDADPVSFLRDRIFTQRPAGTRAVGFKLLYGQNRDFTGLHDLLEHDIELRLLHLKRRNLLRALVSSKIAQSTGVWVRQGGLISRSNALRAARHPGRAAAALWRRLRAPAGAEATRRVHLTPDECEGMFRFMTAREERFDGWFSAHPMLTLYYEDLVAGETAAFDEAQAFLDVEPAPLAVSLQRQNPEPLSELIENYDELRRAFADTPHAEYFE